MDRGSCWRRSAATCGSWTNCASGPGTRRRTGNPASALDKILHTDWAPMHERVNALQQRASTPAYYQAARQSLADVTREHTALALQQLCPACSRCWRRSIRRAAGGQGAITQPIWNAARAAVSGLRGPPQAPAAPARRSFRLGGRALRDQVPARHPVRPQRVPDHELALRRREAVLAGMAREADVLWPRLFASEPPPQDRFARIGRVIDQLSTRPSRASALWTRSAPRSRS